MKIDHTSQTNPIKPGSNRPGTDSTASEFKTIFDSAIQKERHPASALSTSLLSSASLPLASVNAVGPLDSLQPLKAMEHLIDAMDVYQKQLQNPQFNLRDLEPAFERLDKAHDHLSGLAANGSVDPALHGIIEEGLATASMELSRFRNGSYC